MNKNSASTDSQALSRRQFIKSSGAAVVTGALAANELIVPNVHPAGSDVLRVGLIGCGGGGARAGGEGAAAGPEVEISKRGGDFPGRLWGEVAELKRPKENAYKNRDPGQY